jgi:Cu+-exporting ATPase
VSANLSPLFAAILMPLSSITVVSFATFVVRWQAYKQGL